MQYRKLGRSDLMVSEISLGTWLNFDRSAWKKGERVVRKALDIGINFIDTANVYAGGEAEAGLGEMLRAVPRESYVLASKVFFPMPDGDRGLSAAQIEKQLDLTLARLRTNYLDLYQCHRYDPETPLEETMAALTRAVEKGKTRYIGFSEWNPSQISASLALAGQRFVSSQPEYSMIHRDPEAEVFPLCKREGIGQIVWSPLGQGVLTGKYRAGETPPADSRAANARKNVFMQRKLLEDNLLKVERLRPIASECGLSLPQLAIAFCLRLPEVTSAIVGASTPEQLEENARASGVVLTEEVKARIEAALA